LGREAAENRQARGNIRDGPGAYFKRSLVHSPACCERSPSAEPRHARRSPQRRRRPPPGRPRLSWPSRRCSLGPRAAAAATADDRVSGRLRPGRPGRPGVGLAMLACQAGPSGLAAPAGQGRDRPHLLLHRAVARAQTAHTCTRHTGSTKAPRTPLSTSSRAKRQTDVKAVPGIGLKVGRSGTQRGLGLQGEASWQKRSPFCAPYGPIL
jgi:hypothetical protein